MYLGGLQEAPPALVGLFGLLHICDDLGPLAFTGQVEVLKDQLLVKMAYADAEEVSS
jgi:hypothetical protein